MSAAEVRIAQIEERLGGIEQAMLYLLTYLERLPGPEWQKEAIYDARNELQLSASLSGSLGERSAVFTTLEIAILASATMGGERFLGDLRKSGIAARFTTPELREFAEVLITSGVQSDTLLKTEALFGLPKHLRAALLQGIYEIASSGPFDQQERHMKLCIKKHAQLLEAKQ